MSQPSPIASRPLDSSVLIGRSIVRATVADPFFYSYVYPEPDGYRRAKVAHGRFDETYGEFVLPYAEVRASGDPAAMLAEFLQSSYDAAADLAHWDRKALEREPVAP